MSAKGNLQVDPLFIGLTRPAMVMGVSYLYFLINMMITMVGFINSTSFWCFLSAGIIHGIGYVICLKEPRTIELLVAKTSRCMRCKNMRYHGFTNSYDVY
ncbi:MAG: VirB3 family type IV secretion system protein [Alphaproteobacteria bacterium]|nr:VirB3 family type IV secretion system protein [Alphaproteobacteria bacterium]